MQTSYRVVTGNVVLTMQPAKRSHSAPQSRQQHNCMSWVAVLCFAGQGFEFENIRPFLKVRAKSIAVPAVATGGDSYLFCQKSISRFIGKGKENLSNVLLNVDDDSDHVAPPYPS